MAALFAILRFLVILLVVRLVLRVAATAWRHATAPAPRPDGLLGDMVQDPVCRAFVLRERALPARVGGTTVYYCSDQCRAQALAAAS